MHVRATALSSYIPVALRLGLDPYDLLKQVGIKPSSLEQLDNPIPAAATVKLVEMSAAQARCHSFGLLMAEHRSVENIGALMLLLKHLRTARELIESMTRYQRLLTPAFMIDIRDENGVSSIHIDLVGELAQRQAIDFVVASAHLVLRSVLGARWAPDAVHFAHRQAGDLSVHERIFGCPAIFESDFNGFSADSASLDTHEPGEESRLAAYAASYLDTLTSAAPDAELSDRVSCSLYAQLPRGRATLAAVAEDLGLSPRSLQRQIAENGHSFTALLNEVRKQLAVRYLQDPARDITAVSLMSGYSTSSSFNRWFMSEFGETPTAWRARSTS